MEVKPCSNLIFTFARRTRYPVRCQKNIFLAPCWILYTRVNMYLVNMVSFMILTILIKNVGKTLLFVRAQCTHLHGNSLDLLHLFFLVLYRKKGGAFRKNRNGCGLCVTASLFYNPHGISYFISIGL